MSVRKDLLKASVVVIGLVAVGWFLLADRTSRQAATPPKEFGVGLIQGGPVLGCTEEADLKRVLHYFVQGDKAAATEAMTELVDNHRCLMFEDKEKVFIEHTGSSSEIAVRRPGEPDPYWTMSDRVTIQ
jgi:hypothetical protein